MTWELPVRVEVGGVTYPIRSDYRAILDILTALADPDLNGQERAAVALEIFYPDFASLPPACCEEAVQACCRFINGGAEERQEQPSPRLVDWEQDYSLIIAPVNRVLGQEIRSVAYLHWWTFLAAYYEIGECAFAQVVRIRDRRARGKALDKTDQEFYRRNRALVDLKTKYTQQEDAVLSQWIRAPGGEARA